MSTGFPRGNPVFFFLSVSGCKKPMIMWKLYAFLSAFFAALTAVFAKVGVRDVNSDLATANPDDHHPPACMGCRHLRLPYQ